MFPLDPSDFVDDPLVKANAIFPHGFDKEGKRLPLPQSTSFLVNSRTLGGAPTPLYRVWQPHQCLLGSVASYLIYADV